jgi:molybdopterin/thiamine biosynthesis adenylyltransferase/nitroreductase
MSGLANSLQRRQASEQGWKPQLFDAATQQQEIAALLEAHAAVSVHDTLEAQLLDLIETRYPDEELEPERAREHLQRHLDGREPLAYGTWVYYPWLLRLVHLLPEEEFRELRTSRNRNKITREEQALLQTKRVGVIGLSVGKSTALCLAMEELAGELSLADHDTLSLSNLNRLGAGVCNLGINKAVTTAREILELNPYACLRVFTDGINDSNMEEFLAGGAPLDLLFEECDDLYVKVRVRERARALRIPVLMETSDRGLFDVERFDSEPDRPLLHGLIGKTGAEEVRRLSAAEKVPYVLRILGREGLSTRAAASMVEIKSTLKTWPQLASGVALGSAINADAARRILLGDFSASGRYYVDLEQLVADETASPISSDVPEERLVEESLTEPSLPVPRAATELTRADACELVSFGIRAPSGGNCQPWRFELVDSRLRCFVDADRSLFDSMASHLAVGAAVESIILAAGEKGLAVDVDPYPEQNRDLTCTLGFSGGGTSDELFQQIPHRVTNRKPSAQRTLSRLERSTLEREAGSFGARLQVFDEPKVLAELGAIVGACDRLRFLSREMHREMMREIRWSPDEVEATRDGLDLMTLELDSVERAGLRLMASWNVMRAVGTFGGGAGLEKIGKDLLPASCAAGLLTVDANSEPAFFRAGRALQRVWLRATALGLDLHPVTPITYLIARLDRGGHRFSPSQVEEIQRLRGALERVVELPPGHVAPMLFRLVAGARPTARALRRPVQMVLS